MDNSYLPYLLTPLERNEFEHSGYLIIPNALSQAQVTLLFESVDHISQQYRQQMEQQGRKACAINSKGMSIHQDGEIIGKRPFSIRSFISLRPEFMNLIDWPHTFAKVWGVLGWNIQLYSSRIIVSPPLPSSHPTQPFLAWHQDGGCMSSDLETHPQPRMSIKVAYFLTDVSQPGSGNMYIIPGSQKQNELPPCIISDSEVIPEGAIPLCVPAGTAVIFDRRLWHAASPNRSDATRKVLMYGYSYRWLRPRDAIDPNSLAHIAVSDNPIRRQLLGASESHIGYSSPSEADVPLRQWVLASQIQS